MKKNFNYALLGAIALTGAMGFTACSSDSDVVEQNPNYNPTTKEVTTDFVFNVATGNEMGTRMTSANTQSTISETFRGIDHATLMSFIQMDGGNLNDGKRITAATTANKLYDMGEILSSGELDPDAEGNNIPKSRRVIELALPTQTNTLMFWGKAIKNGNDNQQGSIAWKVGKDISSNEFTLNRRIVASNTDPKGEEAYKQYGRLIAASLTKIVQSSHDDETNNITTNWSDYVTVEDGQLVLRSDDPSGAETLCPLGEILGNAYITMNTIYPNEVRAGSAKSVARLLGDLYVVISKVAQAVTTSNAETLAKQVAQQIQSNISTVISDAASNPTWTTSLSGIKTFAGVGTEVPLVTEDLNGYPTKIFGVPAGAATLSFNVSTRTYIYNENIPTYSMSGTADGSFNIFNYRYPAELCYFGNSPVRVTDEAHVTTDYPDGVANWDNDDSWAAGATGASSKAWTKNAHVLSNTRSVAMQENINYGTALLKTTVRYNTNELEDNNTAIQQQRQHTTEAPNIIPVAAGTFTLTGILIGGVEPTMGWNYVSKAAAPTFASFVYDSDIPNKSIPASGYSEPNYTLVWDNWNPANIGSKQNVVYIALEFVNNSGKDFWGMNNMIRNGATFYITGKLDPDEGLSTTDRSAGIVWPTKYALPPYDASGNTIKERRIFIQDYMTEANFVINKNSLKSAIVAVPDLRSTQISLGLSVDLRWSTGLSFDEVILGQ